MKFVGIVGSNAKISYNRKLLYFIKKHFAKQFELEILEIDNIPLFNQDLKWDENFQLRLLYNKITRADGVIISTPEHNHTISPALKSVIEWLRGFLLRPRNFSRTSSFAQDFGCSRSKRIRLTW